MLLCGTSASFTKVSPSITDLPPKTDEGFAKLAKATDEGFAKLAKTLGSFFGEIKSHELCKYY